MLFKTGQKVKGTPGTIEEFMTAMVIDTDSIAELVLVTIISCEYDQNEVGEEHWMDADDLVLIEDLNYTGSSSIGELPAVDMNQALVLGLI